MADPLESFKDEVNRRVLEAGDRWTAIADAHLAELVERVEQAEVALAYYAERRNHTTMHDGTPHLWSNDSYDGEGPGARARSALAAAQGAAS